MFDPFADGSWKTIPEPAVAATFKTPLPDVEPLRVSWPPVVPLIPVVITPETANVGLLIVVVPPAEAPILILEVEPAAPPVPRFTVLVVPVAVAFVE